MIDPSIPTNTHKHTLHLIQPWYLSTKLHAALVGPGDSSAWRARGWSSQAEFEQQLRRRLAANSRAPIATGQSEESATALAARLRASVEVHVIVEDEDASDESSEAARREEKDGSTPTNTAMADADVATAAASSSSSSLRNGEVEPIIWEVMLDAGRSSSSSSSGMDSSGEHWVPYDREISDTIEHAHQQRALGGCHSDASRKVSYFCRRFDDVRVAHTLRVHCSRLVIKIRSR